MSTVTSPRDPVSGTRTIRRSAAVDFIRLAVRAAGLAAISVSVVAATSVFAGSGGVVTLPMGGVKNRSGLRLEVDMRWVAGGGYRPVRLRIAPQPFGPAPADRLIEVRLRPHGWSGGTKAGTVTGTVELKQGDFFGEAILPVPQTNYWNAVGVETREDGVRHRELSVESIGVATRFVQYSPDNSPSIMVVHWAVNDRTSSLTGGAVGSPQVPAGKLRVLFFEPRWVLQSTGIGFVPLAFPHVGSEFPSSHLVGPSLGGAPRVRPSAFLSLDSLPDLRALAGRFPEAYGMGYGGTSNLDVFSTGTPATDSAILTLLNDVPNVDLLPPHLLPDRWLDYTSIDLLLIARGELQWLREQYPQKWSALRTWLRTGPTLAVYDAGKDFERLPEIEQLMQSEARVRRERDGSGPLAGWDLPDHAQFKAEISFLQANGNTNVWPMPVARATSASSAPPAPPPLDEPPFVSRAFGQGRLVAIAAENPFPGTAYQWNWLLNSLPPRHWLTYQRQGASQYHENVQFWNFLVEGIGRAPVKTFLGLITLFAILIGPVNYFWLHRRRRLYWLLVTVPVGSLLVSFGLFLFAMAADGLGTRVRLRSYTELDQRAERAISWSRQTYYSGFAPSRGLLFPAAAAVYPIEHRPLSVSGMEDTSRELVWTDRQRLAAGYFYSRTMSQFMIVEPQTTQAAVRVVESVDGSPPVVSNELGAAIEQLVLRDAHRTLYQVLNLAPGQKVAGSKLEKEQGGAEWRSIYRRTRPEYPPAFDPRALDDVTQFFSSSRWNLPRNSPAPLLDTCVLEVGLRESLEQDFERLEPGSFVAILPRSPFVSLGVDSVSHETGFHVVTGRW